MHLYIFDNLNCSICLQPMTMDLISLILCAVFVVLIIPTILWTMYHQYVLRRKLKNIPQCGTFPFGVAFELLKLTDYGKEL